MAASDVRNNSFVAVVAVVALMVAGTAYPQASSDVRSDIRAGVPRTHQGVLERYDVSAVPELIAMMNAEADKAYWPSAAFVLAVVGDDRAVDALIELIERPPDSLPYISKELHDARQQAMRSLGAFVHRTDNQEALDYLIESLDDTIWRRRGVRGVVDYMAAQDRYDRLLSLYAIYGLSLSGHPRAGAALRSLRDSPMPNQERLRAGHDGELDHYIGVNDLVAEKGLMEIEADAERQSQISRRWSD